MKRIRGALVFAPPKRGKLRDVPLPGSVAASLHAHAKRFPTARISLASVLVADHLDQVARCPGLKANGIENGSRRVERGARNAGDTADAFEDDWDTGSGLGA